ncbi:MAG: alkyl hydroperoxide reductase [Gemmatimonadaceae bacterium]
MRELERQFPDDVVVVGIHSGKFTGERETPHIRDASIRLGAVHATLNDRQFRVWRAYAVNAWPTLVAVDPRGYVVGTHAGEFSASDLVPFVERVLATARAAGALASGPLHFAADAPANAPGELAFPGKVVVDGRRIAIADSAHHRVLVGALDDAGTSMHVEQRFGGDAAGYRDGRSPQFDNPQGLAFGGDTLYVADAGNHCIRAIDLRDAGVRTLAGTGRQARTSADLDAGALSSPWDVACAGGELFVAMAGIHQLWSVDAGTGKARVHCGSGAEELHDGSLAEAALAQPMGLCVSDGRLYFTDSESSAVRSSALSSRGRVETIVGTGLFDFGDVDGSGDDVRLQHPQGIARAEDGRLLVADSYNGALKWIDPASRIATTWVGGLDEPGGIALTPDRVYVADTNRHRIAIVDRASGVIAGELHLVLSPRA